MFRSNIQASELFEQIPKLKEFIKYENTQTVLNSSALQVVDDLRKRQIDASKIYIPLYLTANESKTVGNEKRIVIDVSSVSSGTFIVYGSDDGTTFQIISNVDGTPMQFDINTIGRYTARFGELYQHIKYTVSGDATAIVYLVETAFDSLIKLKTLCNIALPIMGTSDDAKAMYEQATLQYDVALASYKYDYDRDESGTIETTERNVNKTVRILR